MADDALDFEAALARLEQLVAKLEEADLGLEESLAHFEQGVRLVRLCSERLRAAEVRVKELALGRDGPALRDLGVVDAEEGD